MANKSSATDWNTLAKLLHWLIVVLLLTTTILGFFAESMQNSPAKLQLFISHKSMGITVLLVMLVRLLWRAVSEGPAGLEGLPAGRQRMASLGHGLIYILALAVPLSGWWLTSVANYPFHWFGLFEVPLIAAPNVDLQKLAVDLHGSLFAALLLLVLGHVFMAIYHHRAGLPVISRMLFFVSSLRYMLLLVLLLAGSLAVFFILQVEPAQSGGSGNNAAGAQRANQEQSLDGEQPGSSKLEKTAGKNLGPRWSIVEDKSALKFVSKYAGSEFTGQFQSFSPKIWFDPQDLSSAYFDVRIATASATTDWPDMNAMLGQPEWFDSGQYPEARYRVSKFVPTESGYRGSGELLLKGTTAQVAFEFTWQQLPENKAQLTGSAQLQRTDFDIGSGSWANDPSIDKTVQVQVGLLLIPFMDIQSTDAQSTIHQFPEGNH